MASAASSAATLSRSAMRAKWARSSGWETRRRKWVWQRDRMVVGTFRSSVVASMNFTCGGGSSSVLSSALKAAPESMWTSSRMITLKRPWAGR